VTLSEPLWYLIVFGAGLAAGVVNVMAGGGSLLTLPALMLLGMPAALANGTNRIGILVQNVVAVDHFRRRGVYGIGTGMRYAVAALPGAVVGALVAIEISDRVFRLILAGVLVFSVVALLVPRRTAPAAPGQGPRRAGWPAYAAFAGIGLYGGFIQAGIGFVYLAVLHRMLRLDLIKANMLKLVITAVYTVPALLVFIVSGNVDWIAGAVLAAGTAIGAWLSARISLEGGERVIRIVVGVALAAMAVQLL
jgi:uncharacterized membrane protein YfcA